MNLRQIDLNLLTCFDALMQTRHVTRAAQLLGIGQPGMSSALARLRITLGDDVLVKQGSEMVPTPRALALAPEVRRILMEIERLVSQPESFDPQTAVRTISLRMSDLLSLLMLPNLAASLQQSAPGIALEIVHLGPAETIDSLEQNRIELAISMDLEVSKSIRSEPLFRDEIVVVARTGHPLSTKLKTLEGFLAADHIRVAQSPIDDRFADRQLRHAGRDRSIKVTVPHWLAVSTIVAETDLVAILPKSLAQRFSQSHPITIHAPPLNNTSFEWSLFWHRRLNHDAAIVWLRNHIKTLATGAL